MSNRDLAISIKSTQPTLAFELRPPVLSFGLRLLIRQTMGGLSLDVSFEGCIVLNQGGRKPEPRFMYTGYQS
jgi:hypothetical protein